MAGRGLLLVAGLLSLAACANAQQYQKFKEVPGLVKAEDGNWILEHEGVKYVAYKEDGSRSEGGFKGIFFVNTETSMAQWTDPRAPPEVKEIIKETKTFEIKAPEATPAAGGTITIAFVAMVPLILFIAIMAGRIAYLQMYYPELLWPIKERKHRRKSASGKVKAQKTRGKLNQDGKGGRSANS